MSERARYAAALRLIAAADLLRTFVRAGIPAPDAVVEKAKAAGREYERLSGTDGVRRVRSGRSGPRRWETRK